MSIHDEGNSFSLRLLTWGNSLIRCYALIPGPVATVQDLAPSEKVSPERRQQKKADKQSDNGSRGWKADPSSGLPLENFVICPQGVCSFSWTAGERPTDEGERLNDGAFSLKRPHRHLFKRDIPLKTEQLK